MLLRAPWISAVVLSTFVASTAAAQSAPGLPPTASSQGSAPPEPPPQEGASTIYSPGLAIAGIVLMAAGVIAMTGGAVLFGTNDWSFADSNSTPGKVALIGGGGALLLGLPLLLVGAHRVSPDVSLLPTAVPRIAVSPRGVAASWSF